VFCSGHDLKHFSEHFGTPEEHAVSTARGGFAGLVQRARTKPLIAAVDGLATAGGFEMVLACDIVVATTRAAFALPETRWNLIASGGGVFLAPRILGRVVAGDMMLTGQELTAQRAYALGLVGRLVEPAMVDDEAMEVALSICANAPLAIALTMATITKCESLDYEAAWALALRAEQQLRGTNDLREGLRSFVEKRAPVWTGT
jgi:enoyl-CoA hydratase